MIGTMRFSLRGYEEEIKFNLDLTYIPDATLNWFLEKGAWPEPEVSLFLGQVLKTGDLAIDGGANIGYFSLLMSKLVGPSGSVVAFEPSPRNLAHLHENLNLNAAQNVKVVGSGLWSGGGKHAFIQYADGGYNSLYEVEGVETQRLEPVTVDLVPLCAYCERAPKVVKLDVEGSEMEALQGLFNNGAGFFPPFIVVEMNPTALAASKNTPASLQDYMANHGYRIFTLSPAGGLPALVPEKSVIRPTRENCNVLFSNMRAIHDSWPQVDI